MSKTSFVSFCIENYADHIGKPSNEIYALFRKEGLLDMLREDYDDLHGMGIEYMIHFCDDYLKGSVSAVKSYESGGQMMHATIRATLMPEILRLISEKYGCDEKEAMDCFYNSATGASFSDDDTGLYGQSALYNFGLYVDEIENKRQLGEQLYFTKRRH
jgi:hypothetical protein